MIDRHSTGTAQRTSNQVHLALPCEWRIGADSVPPKRSKRTHLNSHTAQAMVFLSFLRCWLAGGMLALTGGAILLVPLFPPCCYWPFTALLPLPQLTAAQCKTVNTPSCKSCWLQVEELGHYTSQEQQPLLTTGMAGRGFLQKRKEKPMPFGDKKIRK